MYHLCIDTIEKIGGEIHSFDGTSEKIMCVEGTKKDTKVLALIQSRICDLYYISELDVAN